MCKLKQKLNKVSVFLFETWSFPLKICLVSDFSLFIFLSLEVGLPEILIFVLNRLPCYYFTK